MVGWLVGSRSKLIHEVIDGEYVDPQTRAVFVQFTTCEQCRRYRYHHAGLATRSPCPVLARHSFNPVIETYTAHTVTFEFMRAGGVYPSSTFETVPLCVGMGVHPPGWCAVAYHSIPQVHRV